MGSLCSEGIQWVIFPHGGETSFQFLAVGI